MREITSEMSNIEFLFGLQDERIARILKGLFQKFLKILKLNLKHDFYFFERFLK